jgi:hypothetical protein
MGLMAMKKRQYTSTKNMDLPARFKPQFLDNLDGRPHIVRVLRNRLQQLKDDCGCNSYQKDILCQRAVFITAKLETMECQAIEKGFIDFGSYTQAVNCLIGLLKSLGLQRKTKEVMNLKSYIKSKRTK